MEINGDKAALRKTGLRVGQRLIRNRITLTSAESLTCGLFQAILGNTPGISAVFPGGLVTYSNEAKHRLLLIPRSVIDKYGVVSKPVALWMAKQSRKIMQTDLAVSFTGAAGPSPLEGRPGGTVWIGIAGSDFAQARLFHLHPGSESKAPIASRNQVRRMVAQIGFKMIDQVISQRK